MVYQPEEVVSLVQYAADRGVLVVPELDQPAHTGAGWDSEEDLLVCHQASPWEDYCVQPPCGQLNLANPAIYSTLNTVFSDMLDMFSPPVFHLGGDEESTVSRRVKDLVKL